MFQTTPDARASAPILHDDDLIDDREVAPVDQDRLAHDGIVDQLVALARSVATPSNIALYGPWGSGKSGIANLLRDGLAGLTGVRFVRFDAFKYADVPLRRNFISAIASGSNGARASITPTSTAGVRRPTSASRRSSSAGS